MALPPVPKQSARPSLDQVQGIIDAHIRDLEQKRDKRDAHEQSLHDSMLSAIMKATFDDSMPEQPDMSMDIYKTEKKDRMGLETPALIEFRSLPAYVQDNLIQAEILPTMWPSYKISGYERVFHYRVMTIFRRPLVAMTACHDMSPH